MENELKPDVENGPQLSSPAETATSSEQSVTDVLSVPPSVTDGGTPVDGSALSSEELTRLSDEIVAALKTVYDPEIPVDIYELGLIYKVDVDDERNVSIDMTLTAPGCPVAEDMPIWVRDAVSPLPGIGVVKVALTFDPPWDPSRMSDEARVALNIF